MKIKIQHPKTYATKSVLRGKLLAIHATLRKRDISNEEPNFIPQIRKKTKPKVSKGKETIKQREINKIEIRSTTGKKKNQKLTFSQMKKKREGLSK